VPRWLTAALFASLALGCDKSPPVSETKADDSEVVQLRQRVHELERELRDYKLEREKRLADERTGIKLNLPSGQSTEIDPAKATLVIEIAADGGVFAGGKSIAADQLDNLFRAAFARDKLTQVIIKADRSTAHGTIVKIMEAAKQQGLTHLAIGTGK
jgi:biopolymer transport protein ExbD